MKYGFLENISKGAVIKGINTSVVALIMVLPDLYKGIISNTISKSQMCKNIGIIGTGAGLGLMVPGVGWAIVAGIAGSMATKFILDIFIKDDIEEMKPIFEKAGNQIAIDYMLTEHESELYSVEIMHILMRSSFWHSCHKACHNATNIQEAYYDFMYTQLDKVAEKIVKTRPPIKLDVVLHNQTIFEAEFTEVKTEQRKHIQQSQQRSKKLRALKQNTTNIQNLLDDF